MPSVATPAHHLRRTFRIDLEYCYTILALLLLTSSLDPFFYLPFGESGSYTDSNPLKLGTTLLVYMIAAGIMVLDSGSALRVATRNPLVVAIFLLPVISVFWTVDQGTTLKRSAAHLLTGILCLYFVARMSPEELFRRLILVLFFGGMASFVFAILLPQYGMHTSGYLAGSWKGIYGHKNELGRICIIALIVSGYAVSQTRTQELIRLSTFGMFALLLLLSQSRTCWLIAMGIIGLIPLFRLLRIKRLSLALRLAPIILLAVAFCAIVAVGSDDLLALMGRDSSFSGRQTLWEGVIAAIKAKYFYLGAGYGAFFTPKGALDILTIYIGHWGAIPEHAHNGLLNTWANIGIPGVVLGILLIVVLAARVLVRLIANPNRHLWAASACLLFLFLVNNVSSSVAFTHSDIAWALIIMVYCYVGMSESKAPTTPAAPIRMRRVRQDAEGEVEAPVARVARPPLASPRRSQ